MKKAATLTMLVAACTAASTAYGNGALNFRVPLSGEEEVAPVTTDTTGWRYFMLTASGPKSGTG